jgi:hypothetical protein
MRGLTPLAPEALHAWDRRSEGINHIVSERTSGALGGLKRMPVRPDVCKSYYLDAAGRNHIIWPEYGFVIKRKLSPSNISDYEVSRRAATQSVELDPTLTPDKPARRQSSRNSLKQALR